VRKRPRKRAVLPPEALTEVVLSRPEADEARVRTLPLARDRHARPVAPVLTFDDQPPGPSTMLPQDRGLKPWHLTAPNHQAGKDMPAGFNRF